MKTKHKKNELKKRYVSFKMGEFETYIEDVPLEWSIDLIAAVMERRIKAVKDAMPQAEWSLEVVNVYGGQLVDNFKTEYKTIFTI